MPGPNINSKRLIHCEPAVRLHFALLTAAARRYNLSSKVYHGALMDLQRAIYSLNGWDVVHYPERTPQGHLDKKHRWFPYEQDPDHKRMFTERRDCCDSVRSPTKKFPWSLWKHCKSLKHIAALCEVDYKDLCAAWTEYKESETVAKLKMLNEFDPAKHVFFIDIESIPPGQRMTIMQEFPFP